MRHIVPREFCVVLLIFVCGSHIVNASGADIAGTGKQLEKPISELPPAAKYLALVIRLGRCSSCVFVQRATTVSGQLVVRTVPSGAFYEITKNGQTFFVGSLPDDLFQAHGFSLPSKPGESVSQTQSSALLMYIPDIDVSIATGGSLGVNIYLAKSGCCIKLVSGEQLEDLKERGTIYLKWYLSRKKFASQVRSAASKRQVR